MAAGTFRAALSISFTDVKGRQPGRLPEGARFTGGGAFDAATRTGRLRLDISDLVDSPSLREWSVVYDGLVLYVSWPGVREAALCSSSWLSIQVPRIGRRTRGFGFHQALNQVDPNLALAYLDGARRVGTERVSGVATTRYRLTVELANVVRHARRAADARIRLATEQLLEKTGITEIPTDVWIDKDGRVRRIALRYPDVAFDPGSFHADAADVTLTVDLYDFGTPVDVKRPRANEARAFEQYAYCV